MSLIASPIARRSGGLLGSFLVLHLSLLAGDSACGSHAAASEAPPVAEAPATASGAHAAHHQHDGAVATQTDRSHEDGEEPCKTPSRERCCEAMASCVVQIAFSDAAERTASPRNDSALRGTETAPASSAPSPETPPPKA
jgi:hypothetical protein